MFEDEPKQFIVVTPGGVAIHATPDPYEAADTASRLGPYEWLAPTPEEIAWDQRLAWAANPARRLPRAGPSGPPSEALRLSGLPRFVSEAEVDALSPEKAHALLVDYFVEASQASMEHARAVAEREGKLDPKTGQLSPEARGTASVAIKLGDWTSPVKGWLSDNAKLQKRKGRQAVALGLNLLPESSVFNLRSVAGVQFLPPHLNLAGAPAPGVEPPVPTEEVTPASTFCQGASLECKKTCLVNVGQNAASMRANYSKFAKAKALLEQPVAFMRILVEALKRYSLSDSEYLGGDDASVPPAKRVLRLVRLNVLSDIPWEEVAPWLFFRFPRLVFYDCTKVAGRPLMSSTRWSRTEREPKLVGGRGLYDLSFSYSGNKVNAKACMDEFDGGRGRRIVQVYVAPGYLVKSTIEQNANVLASDAVRRALKLKKNKTHPEYDKYVAAEDLVDKVALQAWLRLNPLPKESTIGGLGGRAVRVIDGDETDFRPLDPTDVIVGLRWKPAKVVVKDEEADEDEDEDDLFAGGQKRRELAFNELPKHFVLYGDVVETDLGSMFLVAESPSSSGGYPEVKKELSYAFLREASRNEARAGMGKARKLRVGRRDEELRHQWSMKRHEPGRFGIT